MARKDSLCGLASGDFGPGEPDAPRPPHPELCDASAVPWCMNKSTLYVLNICRSLLKHCFRVQVLTKRFQTPLSALSPPMRGTRPPESARVPVVPCNHPATESASQESDGVPPSEPESTCHTTRERETGREGEREEGGEGERERERESEGERGEGCRRDCVEAGTLAADHARRTAHRGPTWRARAYPQLCAVAFGTESLHAYGLDSVRILFPRGETTTPKGNSPRNLAQRMLA